MPNGNENVLRITLFDKSKDSLMLMLITTPVSFFERSKVTSCLNGVSVPNEISSPDNEDISFERTTNLKDELAITFNE